ncbi:MAG: Gfo/Idh/MocA family oxidoreductase [Terracidiphilus sp.]|jgi:hypothetical protein
MTENGTHNRLRVLLIGAGRRIQNNFLPSLKCLDERFEVVGIHSRTAERLQPVADRWRVPAVLSLDDVDFSAVDVAAISVPTLQNSFVLDKLRQVAGNVRIVIDTPMAWTPGEYTAIRRSIPYFKQMIVAEDYMNFPTFALLRKAVNDGLIGKLQTVTLNNIGYLYHGLALIRSFSGFKAARRTWSRSAGWYSKIVGYDFGSYKAVVVGPYRRHSAGGITIEGSQGILTDFAYDAGVPDPGGRPTYLLKTRRETSGLLTGISLENAGEGYSVELPDISKMAAMGIADTSDLNLQRGCGLMHVFRALLEPENINNLYGPENAFYDSFVSRLAGKGLLPVDPFTWFGSDAMIGLRLAANLKSAGAGLKAK